MFNLKYLDASNISLDTNWRISLHAHHRIQYLQFIHKKGKCSVRSQGVMLELYIINEADDSFTFSNVIGNVAF